MAARYDQADDRFAAGMDQIRAWIKSGSNDITRLLACRCPPSEKRPAGTPFLREILRSGYVTRPTASCVMPDYAWFMVSPDRQNPGAGSPLFLVTLFEDEAAATRSELVLSNALAGLDAGFSLVRRAFAFDDVQRQPELIAAEISSADIIAVAAASDLPLPPRFRQFFERSIGGRSSPAALVAVCIETSPSTQSSTVLEGALRELADRHRLRMIVTHTSLRVPNEPHSASGHNN